MDVSTGGDLLALRAQLRGVQGELTDGCLRDTDDIAAFGFPAYSAGTAPNKSAYDIETVGVDVPVTLCGVLIFPGDMVVMDRTGVVVVPSERSRKSTNPPPGSRSARSAWWFICARERR